MVFHFQFPFETLSPQDHQEGRLAHQDLLTKHLLSCEELTLLSPQTSKGPHSIPEPQLLLSKVFLKSQLNFSQTFKTPAVVKGLPRWHLW